MGNTCLCASSITTMDGREFGNGVIPADEQHPLHSSCPDPLVYDLVRRHNPHAATQVGQHHLLYNKKNNAQYHSTCTTKQQPVAATTVAVASTAATGVEQELELEPQFYNGDTYPTTTANPTTTTRLVIRKLKPESHTHIYAIRSPETDQPEQRPMTTTQKEQAEDGAEESVDLTVDPYIPQQMSPLPRKKVNDWVSISDELNIYIADTGLSHAECDALVRTTEQACKGHYAAYTYAKQTLGCREFPTLARACFDPVHRVTHCIWKQFPNAMHLQLDDREPHIVKYDVTKKERQKLDMHTDKSEWTFLIALSDGCNLDYDGGGTYFEALDATVHVQRGHALIFPGKLRHCGQRITKGLRFLLVGFLVDKQHQQAQAAQAAQAQISQSSSPQSLPTISQHLSSGEVDS